MQNLATWPSDTDLKSGANSIMEVEQCRAHDGAVHMEIDDGALLLGEVPHDEYVGTRGGVANGCPGGSRRGPRSRRM